MALTDSYDIALARYLYENYVMQKIEKTYGDVSKELKKITGIYKDPHMALPHNLGRVSMFCHEELELPLISLGVYTAAGAVGVGFSKMARSIKPEYSSLSDREVQAREKELIKTAREDGAWQRLVDYLDGVPVDVIMARSLNKPVTVQNPVAAIKPASIEDSVANEPHTTDEPIYADENPTMTESARKPVTIDVRERNPATRNKCLEHWGTRCVICGMDFCSVYGDEFDGKIHVHHLKPLSDYSDEHYIDPITDLRPVCPNCHMITHCRKDAPYTIDEVKGFITTAKLKSKS